MELGLVNVLIYVTGSDIQVPSDYVNENNSIALSFSYKFKLPLFEILDKGIHAQLSFKGIQHIVFIPWKNILAFTVKGTDISYDFVKMKYQWDKKENATALPKEKPSHHLSLISFNKEIKPEKSNADLKLIVSQSVSNPAPSEPPPTKAA